MAATWPRGRGQAGESAPAPATGGGMALSCSLAARAMTGCVSEPPLRSAGQAAVDWPFPT